MPFCSSCGSEMKGSFCGHCGARAAASQLPSSAPPGIPTRRGVSPVIWILAAAGGLIALGVIAIAGVAYYVARNPEIALTKLIVAANPDAEVLRVNKDSKQITIRDRRDGGEFTLSFDDVKNGRFTLAAMDRSGKAARIEMGAGSGTLPGWVPVYPGAKVEAHLTGSGDNGDHFGEGGMYSFTTPDTAAQVTSFYRERCRDLGMKVELSTATTNGGRIAAGESAGRGRSLLVVVETGGSGGASGAVTFGRK